MVRTVQKLEDRALNGKSEKRKEEKGRQTNYDTREDGNVVPTYRVLGYKVRCAAGVLTKGEQILPGENEDEKEVHIICCFLKELDFLLI